MFKFAIGRLLQSIPVLLIVITITFFLVHSVPGGPFSADKAVPPEVIKALEAQYNLDQPVWQQYLSYLGDVGTGDLGPSFKYSGRTVNELIAAGLPATAELALYAMLIALSIGVSAGVLASMRPEYHARLPTYDGRYDRHLHALFFAWSTTGIDFWYLSRLASYLWLG